MSEELLNSYNYESSDSFLCKKRAGKRVRHSKSNFVNDLDVEKAKKKFLLELKQSGNTNTPKYINYGFNSTSIGLQYDENVKQYLQNGMSSKIYFFINKIIQDSPSELRIKFQIHKIFYNIAKTFMLNEFELVYLAIALEKMGWTMKDCNFEENLFLTAICVKINLNANYEDFMEYIFINCLKITLDLEILDNKIKEFSNLLITPRVVNSKFNFLNEPTSTACTSHYLDYNNIVDQVIRMSLSYNENKADFSKKTKIKQKKKKFKTQKGSEVDTNEAKINQVDKKTSSESNKNLCDETLMDLDFKNRFSLLEKTENKEKEEKSVFSNLFFKPITFSEKNNTNNNLMISNEKSFNKLDASQSLMEEDNHFINKNNLHNFSSINCLPARGENNTEMYILDHYGTLGLPTFKNYSISEFTNNDDSNQSREEKR